MSDDPQVGGETCPPHPQSPTPLRGLVPVLATPFDDTGAIDERGLIALLGFIAGAGVDGVALFGIAGESRSLTSDERARVRRLTVDTIGSQLPIVAGVSGETPDAAISEATPMAQAGVSLLIVMPPTGLDGAPALLDFYGQVATHAAVPVMVQDAPAHSGVRLDPDLLVKLASVDGACYAKIEEPPTVPKIAAVCAAVPRSFGVFGGQNALFCLDELAAGAIGTMPACEFADLLAAILAVATRGDHQEARRRFSTLLPLSRFGLQPGISWAVHKEVLKRRGIIHSAYVRSPAVPLDRTSLRGLSQVLEDLGMESEPMEEVAS